MGQHGNERAWELEDPTEIASANKYTFYMPSKQGKALLKPGDHVKLIFVGLTADSNTERMWVQITTRDGDTFTGTLGNQPYGMDGLNFGDVIDFSAKHIICMGIDDPHDFSDQIEKYRSRCNLTPQVLEGAKISYLYREEPEARPGDMYPDSGWRMTHVKEDDDSEFEVRSLGFILNKDDSFVRFLDDPVGTKLQWDEKTLEYVRI